MKEIIDFNHKLALERKTSTVLVGILLLSGFTASIPLFTDTVKYSETLFCVAQSDCAGSSIRRGISYLIDRERRNQLFDQNITVIRVLAPEDESAAGFGLAGSLLLFSAYGFSRSLTDTQEKAIHGQFKLLKIKALENDLIERSHIDLVEFSKSREREITKSAIARQSAETIEKMKSPNELQLDQINGKLQGELSLKNHQLHLSELEKAITLNRLTTVETNHKIAKTDKPPTKDKELSSDEWAKSSLIDTLKSHEDGYLWKIINSLKPLWISGNQGSGKTHTAGTIALIRKYCLDAPIHCLIDRHMAGDNADVWEFLQPTIKAETEEDIKKAFNNCCDHWLTRIKGKPSGKEQVVIDEFTNLKQLIGDAAVNFFRASLTDTRKAKTYLVGITHNTTNESFPSGTAAARKSGSILLERFSANGETPLSRVVARYGLVDEHGNSLEDVEKTIPDWFRPEIIYQHFMGKPIEFEVNQ